MRVLIADDSGVFRQGLRLLLEATGLDVVNDVADVPQLLEALRQYRPEACVLDVRMPPTHTDEGVRAAEHIRHIYPDTAVLMLSTYADTNWAQRLLADGRGGIGYLLKDRVAHAGDLVDALQRVATGGTAVDPEIIAALIHRQIPTGRLAHLATRERQVLELMAQGRSNAGIGRRLHLSPKTVECYVANIFSQLQLSGENVSQDDNRRVLAVLTHLQHC